MLTDITPTGSLRRRRSRVLSEEDDNGLMDFLRSSGHDNGSRERKPSSYGSLDRSWARRARSGSATKKRPDLLNIDFGTDRERPTSPSASPVAEVASAQTRTTAPGDDARPRFVQKNKLCIFTNYRFLSRVVRYREHLVTKSPSTKLTFSQSSLCNSFAFAQKFTNWKLTLLNG